MPVSGVRIEIEGIRKLARTLRQAGDEESRAMLLAANREAASAVAADAAPTIPQLTGRLAATLRSSGSAKGGVVMLGKARVPYAGPLHFGWFGVRVWGRTRARRPIAPGLWLYHALDRRRGEVEELYRKRLEALLATIEGVPA